VSDEKDAKEREGSAMRTVGLGTPVRGAETAGAVSWQGSVKDKDLTAPPGSPSTGDRYVVASPATGGWSGKEDDIAEWDGAAWAFDTPAAGWAVWIDDESEIYVFNGSSWGMESLGPHAATHRGGGSDEIDGATTSVAGLMSAADKSKSDSCLPIEANVSTTNDTQTTIATVPIPDDTAVFLIANVVGRRTNGADRACYIRRLLVYRESGGAPAFQGTINTEFTRESATLWNATFVVSGNNILIQVKGRVGDDVNWNCLYTAQSRG